LSLSSRAVHLLAAGLFAVLAIALTWPLALHLHDAVPGANPGDNLTFVWNFWWIRTAIHTGVSPLWTPALFAPLGTSLVLHSATLLPTAAATLALPHADALATHNIAVIATLFLNGLCAYGAAYSLTRQPAASLVAGLIFAMSPFLTVRLEGHFNVLSAWGLPVLVIALARFTRSASAAGTNTATTNTVATNTAETNTAETNTAAIKGAKANTATTSIATTNAGSTSVAVNALFIACALAALAYTDYYTFIFGVVLVALFVLLQRRRLFIATAPAPASAPERAGAPRRAIARACAVLVVVLIIAMIAIALTGGADLRLAGVRISAHDTFNLRTAAWLLGLIALFAWTGARVRFTPRAERIELPWRAMLIAAIALTIALLPLLIAAARLFAQGDYVSQTYFWRSAPPGIDIASLVLGNPMHPLYGGLIQSAYAAFGIDRMESVTWLGLVPLLLVAYAAVRLRSQAEVQRWLWVLALFGVWALGPYVMAFGTNTGFMLPQALMRFVPILSNARIPGRAFVMVALAVAMLAALALASLPRRRAALAAIAAALISIDLWPGHPPLTSLDRPAIYDTLRAQPPGAVLELPLGIRDGFGEQGHLDHRVLFYQTLHEHPLAGGFVARLSPRLWQAYDADPLFGPLLSQPRPQPPPAGPVHTPANLSCAIRYVVMPRDLPAATRELMNSAAQLERIAAPADDARELYRITGWKGTYCR
jgi:succinate dehydrogenase hydrophobic anchor subunit